MGQIKMTDRQIANKVQGYLDACEMYRGEGDLVKGLPTVYGFAKSIGYTKQALYLRAEKSSTVLDSIKAIDHAQADVILTNGLSGGMNATMSIFILKNHGYKDKVEEEVSHEIKVTMPNAMSDYAN